MAKKRSNGDGNIRRTASGRWSGAIMDGYRDDGKRNVVTFTGDTRGEVADKIRNYKNDRERGIKIDKSLSFCDWADRWYEDYRSEVQPSTYANYKYTLKLIKEAFTDKCVADILPIDVNRFLDSLVEKGVSVSLIQKCRAMLIQIFDAADNNNLIHRNPARLAKKNRNKLKGDAEKHMKKDAFTEEEVALLKNGLPDDMVGNSIRVLVGTGLRVQELLALHRSDMAEDGSLICVNGAIKTVDGQPELGTTKSATSKRKIPVSPEYRPYVMRLLALGGSDLIWTKDGATPYYSVGTYRRQYYKALASVPGVRKLSPHCCRHTYVTRLQARGIHMETIAALVGHSSIEVTDNYLHIDGSTLADAVSVLDTAVNHS